MTSRRKRPPAIMLVGGTLLIIMAVVAIIAPLLLDAKASALTADIRMGHSPGHLLGTDSLGRDIFNRTLVATRLTMLMALCATGIAVVVGSLFGTGIVLAGRAIRGIGARGIDLLVSYPPIIIALAITAIFQPGKVTVVVAIGVAFCPQFARLTNTLAGSVSSRDYVINARLVGAGRTRVLLRHIVPNIAAPVLVLTSVGFATSIVSLSGLSFLGLGVQQPSYDWGSLLAAGQRDLFVNPVEALGPAVAILLTGLAAGLFGDGLARFWDPRSDRRAVRRSRVRRADRLAMAAVAPTMEGSGPVARVENLVVTAGGSPLVRGVSLSIGAGEIVGLVGESGSGKSVTAMSMARLLPPELSWTADDLQVAGIALGRPEVAPPAALASALGIVFQDPSTSFNPALRVGTQLTEVSRVHHRVPRKAAFDAAVARLTEVKVSSPATRMHQYPHELSGGMRQRAMIAMSLLGNPQLLIADEPTTALDVTVQADVLRLLNQINTDHGTAILLISHDINVVSALCHRICVMYAGEIVEIVTVDQLRSGDVQHPYTTALLAASPGEDADRVMRPLQPLPGRPPRPGEVGDACPFADRCPLVMDQCREHAPELVYTGDRAVACYAAHPEMAGVS